MSPGEVTSAGPSARAVKPTWTRMRFAADSDLPLTSGTTRSGRAPGPRETLRRTTVRVGARVPPAGRWETTSPRGRLDCTGNESARKPLRSSWANAALWPMPTTLGTLEPEAGVVVVGVVVLGVVVVWVVVGG